MLIKHVAKRKEIQYILTILYLCQDISQRPIVPDKAKSTRKFLLKTTEISLWETD